MSVLDDIYGGDWLKAEHIKGYTPIRVQIEKWETHSFDDKKQIALTFIGKDKRLGLNKTNAQMIAHFLGDNPDAWVGQFIELEVEPVSFQGRIVDAIRVKGADAPAQAAPPIQPEPPTLLGENGGSLDDDIPF